MTLTLREKLNGCQVFSFFVSPHTARTLKPFIYRDNVMRPPWLKLLEDIEYFDRRKLKSLSVDVKMNALHDHDYLGINEPLSGLCVSTEPSKSRSCKKDSNESDSADNQSKSTVAKGGIQLGDSSVLWEDNEQLVEHTYPCVEKDLTIRMEEIMKKANPKEEKRNEDRAKFEKEGNVLKNKEDEREGEKIRGSLKTNKKISSGRTIDFCYVRQEHIRAINTLVEEYFWPNINMEECTLYPEFTVVALYRRLVVGLGAMIPNPNKHNETYITFLVTRRLWQRSGIGSFMLYHLIETCQSTHITLHCSVSRFEALNLYFKFGFKVQCVVLNFYKPYLSSHPNIDMSPHAYYLKYSRNIN